MNPLREPEAGRNPGQAACCQLLQLIASLPVLALLLEAQPQPASSRPPRGARGRAGPAQPGGGHWERIPFAGPSVRPSICPSVRAEAGRLRPPDASQAGSAPARRQGERGAARRRRSERGAPARPDPARPPSSPQPPTTWRPRASAGGCALLVLRPSSPRGSPGRARGRGEAPGKRLGALSSPA